MEDKFDLEGGGADKDWAVADIMFDPEQGMERDREREGFWRRAGERGSGCPRKLRSLFFPDESNRSKLARARMDKGQERVANSQVWISAEGFGSRLPLRSPEEVAHLATDVGNMRRMLRYDLGCAVSDA